MTLRETVRLSLRPGALRGLTRAQVVLPPGQLQRVYRAR